MANYKKSFNFKSGVQVDTDNFIVNANGLVGIGTSVPRRLLDVYGTVRTSGLVTAANVYSTGISTFGSSLEVSTGTLKVGTAVTIDSTSGIITATSLNVDTITVNGQETAALVGYATDGFIIVNISESVIGLHTSRKVAVALADPGNFDYDFAVGTGITMQGDAGLINVVGIITADGGFIGTVRSSDLTGIISNSNLPVITTNINSGLGTFTTLNVGSGGTIITAKSGGNIGIDTTNPVNLIQVGIITEGGHNEDGELVVVTSDKKVGIGTANPVELLHVVGVVSATSFYGSLTGNASSATKLATAVNIGGVSFDGSSAINLPGVNAEGNQNTTGNAASATYATKAGYSTDAGISTSVISGIASVTQLNVSGISTIRTTDTVSRLEITSESSNSSISIGQSVGTGNSITTLTYNNSTGNFVISNKTPGDLTNVIHARAIEDTNSGATGITTGSFKWIYGEDATLMRLTHEGKLGIGGANPDDGTETHGFIVGSSVTSKFAGKVQFNDEILCNDSTIKCNAIEANSYNFPSVLQNLNVNTTTGYSTFFNLDASNFGTIRVGAAHSVGIGTTTPKEKLDVNGNLIVEGHGGFAGVALTVIGDMTVPSEEQHRKVAYAATQFDGQNVCIGGSVRITDSLFTQNLYVGFTSESLFDSNGTDLTETYGDTTFNYMEGGLTMWNGDIILADRFDLPLDQDGGYQAESRIGINTRSPRCAIDVGLSTSFFLPPVMTEVDRGKISGHVGGGTTAVGAVIYNSNAKTLQVYLGDSDGWKSVSLDS